MAAKIKYSVSKEDHLKAIFHLQQDQGMVTTNALAAALRTRPASVTDMLKKLKEQKLLIYERYKGFKLITRDARPPSRSSASIACGSISSSKNYSSAGMRSTK